MANRVLSFEDPAPARSGLEVYLDVDMRSARNQNYTCIPDMPQISDYYTLLHTDPDAGSEQIDVTLSAGEDRDLYVRLKDGYRNDVTRYYVNGRTSKYRVDKLVNVKAVQNSLHQIFTWIPGERVINPEFGSRLQKYLYEGITEQNTEAIVSEIKHCISKWEPRVIVDKVVNVSDVNDTENNTVRIDVVYRIVGLDDEQFRYSYVYHRQSV